MSVGKLFSGTGTVFFHFAEDLVDLFLFHQNYFLRSDVVDRSRYFDLSGLDSGTDGSTVVKELPVFSKDSLLLRSFPVGEGGTAIAFGKAVIEIHRITKSAFGGDLIDFFR